MTDRRAAGQVPGLPGAVRRGNMVATSGTVAPSALTSAGVPAEQQVDEAIAALIAALAEVGAAPGDVIRVEAYLASADVMATWNEGFDRVWGKKPPARTTLIVGFTRNELLFEVQATAIVES